MLPHSCVAAERAVIVLRFSAPLHPGTQHTSAYVSIRYSIRQHTSAYGASQRLCTQVRSLRQHTSAYVSIRQHTPAYVSIRRFSAPLHPGTQFTCFTGTKVQILTLQARSMPPHQVGHGPRPRAHGACVPRADEIACFRVRGSAGAQRNLPRSHPH